MKRTILLTLVVICTSVIVIEAFAVSVTPKDVSIDVTDLVGRPTIGYGLMYLYLFGKNNDDTSLAWEYSNQIYIQIQGSWSWKDYGGPSNYLVLTIDANGLGGIQEYPQGEISFMIDEELFTLVIPRFRFTGQADLISIYVADDGSTYYGRGDHSPVTVGGDWNDRLDLSLDLTPSEAFVPEHLAAAIPEPSTLSLLGLAFVVGMGFVNRPFRRKSKRVG